jgi:hypothetical protein
LSDRSPAISTAYRGIPRSTKDADIVIDYVKNSDVVITKLRWLEGANRPRDRSDIRDVISTSAKIMDWNYIHKWAEIHGTRQLVEEIVASIPPELMEEGPL